MSLILDGTNGVTTPGVVNTAAETIATTLAVTGVTTLQGLTVGRGAGAIATNTAVGASALAANTTGATGVAIGNGALLSNTTASNNTALGYQAGYSNTVSNGNTFLGSGAGFASNVTATATAANTCVGYQAGYSMTTGVGNCFVGPGNGSVSNAAGYSVTTGSKNTILGGYNGNQDSLDIRTESNNIVLSDGEGNVRMHYRGSDSSWKSLAIYNNTTGSGANMTVLSSGTIARSTSSLKYKRDVQDATHGLAEVLQLRPVTYKGKGENDGETVFGGLIAEEVHEAGLTEFVQYAADGSPDALAYGNMVSVLVKAIQEQQALITALTTRITALEAA